MVKIDGMKQGLVTAGKVKSGLVPVEAHSVMCRLHMKYGISEMHPPLEGGGGKHKFSWRKGHHDLKSKYGRLTKK